MTGAVNEAAHSAEPSDHLPVTIHVESSYGRQWCHLCTRLRGAQGLVNEQGCSLCRTSSGPATRRAPRRTRMTAAARPAARQRVARKAAPGGGRCAARQVGSWRRDIRALARRASGRIRRGSPRARRPAGPTWRGRGCRPTGSALGGPPSRPQRIQPRSTATPCVD